ncbi:prostaglandin E synthase 3-like [Penaeus indicus]|uniref:prostaglandin E synthase 3-like n=1 Tax=Penaeus indicus TaxID=29960 RepID=UPI00300C559F
MSTTQSLPPPVTWAQRKNLIFLTICVEDCKSPTINIEADKVYFKGTGGTERKDYEYTYNLYKDIDTDKSRSFVRDRNIELILVKKEEGPYWPHLLKEKTKQHWLKVDFSRWKDEDDSDDEEGQNQDLEEVWDRSIPFQMLLRLIPLNTFSCLCSHYHFLQVGASDASCDGVVVDQMLGVDLCRRCLDIHSKVLIVPDSQRFANVGHLRLHCPLSPSVVSLKDFSSYNFETHTIKEK